MAVQPFNSMIGLIGETRTMRAFVKHVSTGALILLRIFSGMECFCAVLAACTARYHQTTCTDERTICDVMRGGACLGLGVDELGRWIWDLAIIGYMYIACM